MATATATANVWEPNGQFPLDSLTLTTPIFVNSGNYFIKYLMKQGPLYIQPPKCITKQGFIKGGKRMYCDLLFTNENEDFIQWLENLEAYSQRYIYEHRAQWFESDLELHDIENSFTSPVKIFKSGKYYIVRTLVPTRLGKCTLKIFDEDEMDVPMEDIKDATQVLTIWEVLGIKCSTRVFQIDFEIKQMMVIRPDNIFDRCLLGSGIPKLSQPPPPQPRSEPPLIPTLDSPSEEAPTPVVDIAEEQPHVSPTTDQEMTPQESPEDDGASEDLQNILDNSWSDPSAPAAAAAAAPMATADLEMVDLDVQDIPNLADPTAAAITLKPRHDVYYVMYTEAKQKAEEARHLAISAYLEAKRIKEIYKIQEPLDIFPGLT